MPTAILDSDLTAWAALIGAIVVLLLLDLRVMSGRDGHMSPRFAVKASVFWIALAFVFAGILWAASGAADASSYVAGYLVEKSLSLDNVFVFLLLLTAFGIADDERHRLLTYGIVGALISASSSSSSGGGAAGVRLAQPDLRRALVWTGWRLWHHRHDHEGEEKRSPGSAAGCRSATAITGEADR